MSALLAFTLVMYVLVASVVFLAYSGVPFAIRAKISLLAPLLLVFAGLIWIVTRRKWLNKSVRIGL